VQVESLVECRDCEPERIIIFRLRESCLLNDKVEMLGQPYLGKNSKARVEG
jgi:hypothetical protein